MKITFGLVSIIPVILAGCSNGIISGGLSQVGVPVDISVAQKVLGATAISVDPFTGNDIVTPGIYKIIRDQKTGVSFEQICEYDTSQQNLIKDMRSKTTENSEIVEDSLSPIKIKVNVLGVNLSQPYRKIKVSGYNIKRVYSGDSNSPSDWILNNIQDKCRNETLKKNTPYIIVTSVATANNVESVAGGGTSELSFGLGAATVQIDPITPNAEGRRQNRIFAIEGSVVEK